MVVDRDIMIGIDQSETQSLWVDDCIHDSLACPTLSEKAAVASMVELEATTKYWPMSAREQSEIFNAYSFPFCTNWNLFDSSMTLSSFFHDTESKSR